MSNRMLNECLQRRRHYFGVISCASLSIWSSAVLAQPAVSRSENDNASWGLAIIAALIGVFSSLLTSLVTILIKDVLIEKFRKRDIKRDAHYEIFRMYVAPVSAASEKLLWRFEEIFMQQRHHFLKLATLPLVYNDYKRKSTLYRIASLLGWIRAINLELSALPRGSSGFMTPLSKAITKIQSSLADGPRVELMRLKNVAAVWSLKIDDKSEEQQQKIAMQFEVKVYEKGGEGLKHNSNYLEKLEIERQKHICQELADYLCTHFGRANISEAVISETYNRAVAALSFREALIYRDWQDAIGDAMLLPDPDSIRRFKVIGYERFEEFLLGKSPWVEVFRESINDIDFDLVDETDFRSQQLWDLAKGVAEIVASLANTDEKDLVSDDILKKANGILAAKPNL